MSAPELADVVGASARTTSATKSTPSVEREREIARGPSRSATGWGAATPGRFTPLWLSTVAADDHRAHARARCRRARRAGERGRRRSGRRGPASSTPPTTSGAMGRSHLEPRRAPTTTTSSPLDEHDRRGEVADAELRPLQVGDEGERAAELLSTLAHAARPLACSSCVPCEKLSRATSMPAATSLIDRGAADAGPIVATIFVRRGSLEGPSRPAYRGCERYRVKARERVPAGIDGSRRRALPRCAAAGCTSLRGPTGTARRS